MYNFKDSIQELVNFITKKAKACTSDKVIGFKPINNELDMQTCCFSVTYDNRFGDKVVANCYCRIQSNCDIDIDVDFNIIDVDDNGVEGDITATCLMTMFVHRDDSLMSFRYTDKDTKEKDRERVKNRITRDQRVKLVNCIISLDNESIRLENWGGK